MLAGARDFDPLERLRLESSAVDHLPPDAIDSDDAVARAVDAMEPAAERALPPCGPRRARLRRGAAVNIYSVPGGLTARPARSRRFARCWTTGPVRAVSLTAYDPECDAEDRVPPIAMRLLEVVAERVDAEAMRALVQRVSQAAVDVEGERVAQIGPGMLVLLGVAPRTTPRPRPTGSPRRCARCGSSTTPRGG